MFRKYVMQNRSLAIWLSGAALLSGGECDAAGGVLNIVGVGLQLLGDTLA